MTHALGYFVLLVMCYATIIGLWAVGHEYVLDRGEGQPRGWWDWHSKWHLAGSLVLGLAFSYLAGDWAAGFVTASSVGIAVEIAQKFPRDKLGGYFELPDVVWNVLGSAIGALLPVPFWH